MIAFPKWRERFQALIRSVESHPMLDQRMRASSRSALVGQTKQLLSDLQAPGSTPKPRDNRMENWAGVYQVAYDATVRFHDAKPQQHVVDHCCRETATALSELMLCLGQIYALDLLCQRCQVHLGELPTSGEPYCAKCLGSRPETLARQRIVALYWKEEDMAGFDDFPTEEITLIKSDGAQHAAQAIVSSKRGVTSMIVFDERFPVEAGDTVERKLRSGILERYEVEDPGFTNGLGGAGGIRAHFNMKVRNLAARPAATQSVVNNHYTNTGQVGAMGTGASTSGSVFQQNQGLSVQDLAALRELFSNAKDAIANEALDEDVRDLVDGQLVAVDKQLAKEKPNPKLLLPMVTTIATALGTAGAAGQGLEYVNKLIQALSGLV